MVLIILVLISLFSFARAEFECNGDEPCVFTGKAEGGGWKAITYDISPIGGGPLPYKPVSESWKSNDVSIFLSISSFRDKLCPKTLFNLFTKAGNPSRIKVGIVQQNTPDDLDCLEEYCNMYANRLDKTIILHDPKWPECPFKDNVIMRRISSTDAKGPVFARALGSEIIPESDEEAEFCMQTDSHMDFLPDFDNSLLKMWGSLENEYGVLSTYVNDISTAAAELSGKGVSNRHEVPHLCMIMYHGQGEMVRNFGTKCMKNAIKPKLTNALWGAGLSFSKCHAERKTPNDPNLPYIFDGEEFSKAARLWTYGYDVYTPHRVYVLHDYHGSQSDPVHSQWGGNRNHKSVSSKSEMDLAAIPKTKIINYEFADSLKRLKTLLSMPGGETDPSLAMAYKKSRFGLGDRRTIDQLFEFSGVNPTNKEGGLDPKYCGNVRFVPFAQHPLGASYIPHFDSGLTGTEAPVDVPDEGSVYFRGDHMKPLPLDLKTITTLADNSGSRIVGNYHALRNIETGRKKNAASNSNDKNDLSQHERLEREKSDAEISDLSASLESAVVEFQHLKEAAREVLELQAKFSQNPPLLHKDSGSQNKPFISTTLIAIIIMTGIVIFLLCSEGAFKMKEAIIGKSL